MESKPGTNRSESEPAGSLLNLSLEKLQSSIEAIQDRPAYIHVAGVSGAGKSTFAKLLRQHLNGSEVIAIDDYFVERLWDQALVFNHESPNPHRPYIGGLDPAIWDLDLLEEHLETLKQNKSIKKPVFDQNRLDRAGYTIVNSPSVVILEGGNSFSERFRDHADYKLYIDAPLHDRLIRKLVRTSAIYGRTDVDNTVVRYFEKDEPARHSHTQEHAEMADQILSNPSNPIKEFADIPPMHQIVHPHSFDLAPLSSAGLLHPFESFGLTDACGSSLRLQYAIGSKALVLSNISEKAIDSLGQAYELN